MKKTIILAYVLIFVVYLTNSEVVVKKNGDVVKGKITSTRTNDIRVEVKDFEEVKIEKSEISKIYYDENEYDLDKGKTGNETVDNEEIKKRQDLDILQGRYKSFLNAGTGFIVPGAILTLTPLIFGTVPIVYAYNFIITNLSSNNNNPFNQPGFYIPFSYYVILIAVGVSLDIPAIIFFVFSGIEYKKWEEKSNLSFNLGFKN